jgi:hypothetical protein
MKKKFDISPYRPCREALAYYAGKPTFEEAWQECGRGDWMLWIAQKLGVDDRTMTRAKALCANTVRHLMKDSRSTDAIDAALRYADGEITREQLDRYDMDATTFAASRALAAGSYAAAAYYATGYAAAAAAAALTDAADAAADAAGYAADSAALADAAGYAAARNANLLETARICREVLTDEVFKKVKNS